MSRTREENRKLAVCVRRQKADKELRVSAGYVKPKKEYANTGATYVGSLGTAAKAGYYTIAGCARMGQPVTKAELTNIQHFAMFSSGSTTSNLTTF